MNDPPSTSRLRFGPFELDLDKQQLTKNGHRLRLPPQPWKVLALLVSNADRLVTREELQEHLWGDKIVEADKGLNFCIRQIRRALGERAEAPTFVETVPRRGYRFIAPLEKVADPIDEPRGDSAISSRAAATTDPGSAPEVAAMPATRQGRWRPVAVVMILASCSLLAGLWATRWQVADASQKRLAILPFVSDNGDVNGALVAAGVTEELAAELGRLDAERIGMVSLDASRRFSARTDLADELGRALNVELLLRGTLRLSERSTRLHLWLERISDRQLLWTQSFDAGVGTLLSTQTELGERAATALALELGVDLGPSPDRAENPQERLAYLRGNYLLAKDDPAEARRSIDLFEEAITADPRSARAYAGLAKAIIVSGSRQESARARVAARRALALDESLADPHLSLWWITFYYDWDWPKARQHVGRALTLAPESARSHGNYAYMLLREPGNEAAGLASARRALELDPVSLEAHLDLAWSSFYARQFEQAEAQARAALEIYPRSLLAALARIHSLLLLNRKTEAVAAGVEIMRAHDADLSELDAMSALPGSVEAINVFWRRWRAWLEHLGGSGLNPRGSLAAVALELGDRQEALRQIEAAMGERSGFLVYLAVDARFDALRDEPAFDQFLQVIRDGGTPGK